MTEPNRPGSLAGRLAATTRILGIEDDADIAEFLRAYFRASGYDFVHADPDDAAAAMAAVEEHKPDCVLLDVGLRGYSGLDVYRQLRSGPAHRLLPVIVVTADMTVEPQARSTAIGIDGFVSKPFNVNTLADLVGHRIASARRLGEQGEIDEASGALSTAMLAARLADEIGVARAGGTPLAFALVTLRSTPELRSQLGLEGRAWVVRDLVTRAGPLIPDTVTLGRTDDGDLALVAPGTHSADAVTLLEDLLGSLRGVRQLPGGGDIRVDPVAGVAGYPQHASDAAGLFMAADAALADAVDGTRRVALAL